jgi:hypothetical protein
MAAGASGVVVGTPKKKDPIKDMYNVYDASVSKQAGDYDDIMRRFRNIYDDANRLNDPSKLSLANYTPYKAAQTTYTKSADTTRALAELQDLAATGGLSDADQQNLRARGVSPIRAMYATAQRDMDRQRRLNGGYSPNFGAVTSKMARDQSSLIADQMDKVNANIAEMVQSGRLSAAPNYASAAQAESQLKHGIAESNTTNRQQANRDNAMGLFDAGRFNAQNRNELMRKTQDDRVAAARGMTDLYGTTPALANLYGSQARNDRDFTADQKQRKQTNRIGAFRSIYG